MSKIRNEAKIKNKIITAVREGYPERIYARTAPRKEANVIWK